MLWWLISTIFSVWLVDETCLLFLSWSPVASLRKAAERWRGALSPTERERLLELEARERSRQSNELPKKGAEDA